MSAEITNCDFQKFLDMPFYTINPTSSWKKTQNFAIIILHMHVSNNNKFFDILNATGQLTGIDK